MVMEMLQHPYVQALASALGHFIWQGAILGLTVRLVVRAGRLGAKARYTLGVCCLATMAALPIATTIDIGQGAAGASSAVRLTTMVGGPSGATSVVTDRLAFGSASTWNLHAVVVVGWLVGVTLLSLRLFGGWVVTRRLVDGARGPAGPDIRALARRVADRLALSRVVGVFESPTIAVPMLVGWIKPCVILPTAALSGLTPVQVEALLAHELAHVRRHDYLVNLLQTAVETMLFYHPAVWWISRDVRETREHCCDDLAVAVCDRVVYASALADLAAMATVTAGPRLALAATDGSLVGRVRRILGGRDDGREVKPGWWPAVLLALAVAGMAPIALSSAARTPRPAPPVGAAQTSEPAKPQTTTRIPAPTGAQLELQAREVTAPVVNDGGPQEPDRDEIEQARIKKLRATLAAIESAMAEIQSPEHDQELKALRDQLAAVVDQLKEAGALRERTAEARGKTEELLNNEDQLREMKATLAVAERKLSNEAEGSITKDAAQRLRDDSLDRLDRLDELKMKLAELDQLRAELAMRDQQTLGEQNEETKAKLAQMEAESMAASKAKLDAEQARAADGGNALDIEAKIAAVRQREEERLATRAADEGATTVDSKRVLSLIGPALKAGPGEISVVGDVKHPGPIKWEEGLTAAAAMVRAGGPVADDVDVRMGRLSEMNLTWSAEGPDSRLRIDVIEPTTTLRAGDVMVVTTTKRK
jgi:beta-lactamase regulating signal transducer with metallopeptidase domain